MHKTIQRKTCQKKYDLEVRNMRKEKEIDFCLAEDHKETGKRQQKTLGKVFKTSTIIPVWTSLFVVLLTGTYQSKVLQGWFGMFYTVFIQNGLRNSVSSASLSCKILWKDKWHILGTHCTGILQSQSLGVGVGWCGGRSKDQCREGKHVTMRECPRESLDGKRR